MNIEVEVPVTSVEKRKVSVSLPAYYKHDVSSDYSECIIYGMVDETLTEYAIHIADRYMYGGPQIELHVEKHGKVEDFQAEYQFGIAPEHRSSREEFEAAWAKAREALRPLSEGT